MFRRTTVALGTFVSIEFEAPAGIDGRALLEAATAVFATVEAAMHPTRETSDLQAIARAATGEVVQVRPQTFDVLELARRFWLSSGGLFDPCVPEQPGRLGDLEFLAPLRVRRGALPVALDLGGVAKGFAVDRAVDTLRAAGCTRGLVNAGGDVRVFGPEPQVIELRAGNARVEIALREEAVAVSAPKSAHSPSEHRGFYSPLTAAAIEGRAVAVRAPTASVADALTKCAILCDTDVLHRLLVDHSAQLIDLG